MKRMIMDYFCEKNSLNIGVDLTQNGRMEVILDFRYNICMKQVHTDRESAGRWLIVEFDGGMCSTECL